MGQEYDKFKKLVKEWLDSHPNEYADFVEEMNGMDFRGFSKVFNETTRLVPKYRQIVGERMGGERNPDFEKLENILLESDFAEKVVNEFHNPDKRSIVPAMLAWLYYGRSYECMVEQNEELIKRKDVPRLYKWLVSCMVKFIIRKSISSGMRTKEDWQDFRKQQKAIEDNTLVEWSIEDEEDGPIGENGDVQGEGPITGKTSRTAGRKADTRTLSELLMVDQDAFIKKIGTRLRVGSSNMDIAHLYIALVECGFMHPCPIKTFRNALQNQFRELRIVQERGIQRAYNELNSPYGISRRLMKDTGRDHEAIEELKDYLSN